MDERVPWHAQRFQRRRVSCAHVALLAQTSTTLSLVVGTTGCTGLQTACLVQMSRIAAGRSRIRRELKPLPLFPFLPLRLLVYIA